MDKNPTERKDMEISMKVVQDEAVFEIEDEDSDEETWFSIGGSN
jgi:hypothetical protein